MKKIAVVTDSSCDIPNFLIEKYNIRVAPLRIIYKDKEYCDGVDISHQEIYDHFKDEVPTTSMPSPEDVKNIFDELVEEGYTDAICITISSGMSGTYNMFNVVAGDYEESQLNIKIIDSKVLSMALGYLVLETAKLLVDSASQDISMDMITQKVYEVKDKVVSGFVVKTLEYLIKGGRIGKVEGKIADVLHIKPIIAINEEGVYYSLCKVRGWKNSFKKIREILEKNFSGKDINITIVHADAEEDAKKMLESVKNMFNVKEAMITHISPALTVHAGMGLIGYIAYEA